MRVAFVPCPPFLLPGLGGGPPGLGAACRDAVGRLEDPVTVLGAAPVAGPVTGSCDPTPWGAAGAPTDDPLPLSLAVGTTLLGGREHVLVGATGQPVEAPGDLLVVGDGTAMRSEKAPGHLDPRAAAFDDALLQALAAGDPDGLLALDPALAGQLWVGGLPAWRSAAPALQGRTWQAEVLWSGAPFGVCYAVATWVS